MKQRIDDKNWISRKVITLMLGAWVVLIIIGIALYEFPIVSIVLGALSLILLLMIVYFSYARYQLSERGGNLQSKISNLLTSKIDESAEGRLLDIGCGSGILAVEMVIKCPNLKVDAIDYWGGVWGYSKEGCENLAVKNNVSERVSFTQGSAVALPFDDESFDIVISNMVFHEVADAKDKREVIKESLRVLKKGGTFVFQDLLKVKKLYGDIDNLITYVENLGIEEIHFEETCEAASVPPLLKNKMFFGGAGLIYGRK